MKTQPLMETSMIDADVLVGHYPFRPFPHPSQDLAQLKAYLQARGIQRACLASLHAAFYADPQQGNAELLPQAALDPFFLPVATINPTLQNWRDTLARCAEEYGCPLVRLLPNYHLYSLDAGCVDELFAETERRGLRVAIVKRLEDERMHSLLMKVPGVENHEISALAQRYGGPLLIQSAYFHEIKELATASPQLYFDIAFAETLNTLHRLTESVAIDRLVFSSHTPFFYPEAAIGKMTSWQGSQAERQQIASGTLTALLARQ
ncbi:MAG: hypothetical protein KF832_01150 [Caldilineaceae bacterium]|nr:hypothetical protein [Caldilineaceae bacterium]